MSRNAQKFWRQTSNVTRKQADRIIGTIYIGYRKMMKVYIRTYFIRHALWTPLDILQDLHSPVRYRVAYIDFQLNFTSEDMLQLHCILQSGEMCLSIAQKKKKRWDFYWWKREMKNRKKELHRSYRRRPLLMLSEANQRSIIILLRHHQNI